MAIQINRQDRQTDRRKFAIQPYKLLFMDNSYERVPLKHVSTEAPIEGEERGNVNLKY